jgi:sulfhydrogenase subunit beta (sulfur reductase)
MYRRGKITVYNVQNRRSRRIYFVGETMEKMIIPKKNLAEFVEKALKEYKVIAPTDNEGVILFKEITSPSEMVLEFANSNLPAKSVLLQQTETLFTFSQGKTVAVTSPDVTHKKLILGIRPCDAQSFAILDHVFAGEYSDPYVTRRENTVLVGLTCLNPGITCFCTSVGGGPSSAEYTDMQLTDIGKHYYVEVATDKGKALVESMSELFAPATEEDEKKKKGLEEKAQHAMTRTLKTDGIVKKLENMFESPFWKNIALRCLGCAICTYVCPTCHCFDMLDEKTGTRGARIRVWDSCMYPEYTVHASGHNPRPERMNRVRNRVYHKFNYFPKNCDVIACVGCGRCIEACPVNIDIIDVVNKAQEVNP